MSTHTQNRNPEIGVLPPYNHEVEQLLLGAVLIFKEAYYDASAIIKSADYFYHEHHQKIWEAMCDLIRENKQIDIATVPARIQKNGIGNWDVSEMRFYVARLSNMVGGIDNAPTHAAITAELYIKRRILDDSHFARQVALDPTADAFEALEMVATRTDEINTMVHGEEARTYKEIAMNASNAMLTAADAPGHMIGLTTGLTALDRHTQGMRKGHLIILAARPAMGKTALGKQMAEAVAKAGSPVGFFSAEMTSEELVQRDIARNSGMAVNTIMKGNLSPEQKQRVVDAAYAQAELPIHMHDEGGIHIHKLCAIAKVWKRKFNIEALFVDYLQKLRATGIKSVGNREQEISYIASMLKDLAKQLDIPVIALAQLSREVEKRNPPKPMMSDLRESGAIEQEADAVWFLYRPEYYSLETFADDAQTPAKGKAEIFIAKFRGGKTGSVLTRFIDYLTCFADVDELPAYNNPPPATTTSKLPGYRDYSAATREEDTPF